MPILPEEAGSPSAGCIYILLNPSLPRDWLKIGITSRTPEQRARELSAATGVPTRFVVAYEEWVSDRFEAERRIHTVLNSFRVNQDREFFRVPLKVAITLIAEIARDFSLNQPELPQFRTITLRAGGPMNVIPKEELRLRQDGAVQYVYVWDGEETHLEWMISTEALQRVRELWETYRPLEFSDEYTDAAYDIGSLRVQLECVDGTKKTIRYGSWARESEPNPPPDAFWEWKKGLRRILGVDRRLPFRTFQSIEITLEPPGEEIYTVRVDAKGAAHCEVGPPIRQHVAERVLPETALEELQDAWEEYWPLRFAGDEYREYNKGLTLFSVRLTIQDQQKATIHNCWVPRLPWLPENPPPKPLSTWIDVVLDVTGFPGPRLRDQPSQS